MEILVKIFDELDDLFGPVVSMASAADLAYGAASLAALFAGYLSGSVLVALAGLACSSALIGACQVGRRFLARRPAKLASIG